MALILFCWHVLFASCHLDCACKSGYCLCLRWSGSGWVCAELGASAAQTSPRERRWRNFVGVTATNDAALVCEDFLRGSGSTCVVPRSLWSRAGTGDSCPGSGLECVLCIPPLHRRGTRGNCPLAFTFASGAVFCRQHWIALLRQWFVVSHVCVRACMVWCWPVHGSEWQSGHPTDSVRVPSDLRVDSRLLLVSLILFQYFLFL